MGRKTEHKNIDKKRDSVMLQVYLEEGGDEEQAMQLAKKLGTELLTEEPERTDSVLLLHFHREGLTLRNNDLTMQGDFTRMLPRLKQNNLSHEFLVKAAKMKHMTEQPLAVDATAGMGEDSLLLAAAGFRVRLYEYDPVIAAILRDTLKRSANIPELQPVVARMELCEENSLEGLRNLPKKPDVVVLDPMFPERSKSASIKKKFQLLQLLERPCSEEEELMKAAIAADPRKIVVKRPLKGPFLAGIKPEYSLSGKAIRYDCLMIRKDPVV